MSHEFLIEIGCEELPPKALVLLSNALANGIRDGLNAAGLAYLSSHAYATPRRLAVRVSGLQAQQADKQVERRGPALQAAFDKEGSATKAALGFARSCGVSVDGLETLETDKGQWLVFKKVEQGRDAQALLPTIVEQAIRSLPIPKPMRWGAHKTEFVRPVHWVLMLCDDRVIEAEILGKQTADLSYGHRFHHPQAIQVQHASEYPALLEPAKVIADFNQRKQRITEQIAELVDNINGQALLDDKLLDEVTALVEWPVALLASFSSEFLSVPSEALVAAMNGHQKSFALCDPQGALLPHFITVANIEPFNATNVIKGNEKVMRARLSDAAFFYQQDCQQSLLSRIESTRSVVFQEKLGTLYDKSARVSDLADYIAAHIDIDTEKAKHAASLAKTDLMTGMVGEFPELQGIMGYYYALHDGEDESIALAMKEQYYPRFSGDALGETPLGNVLALAERVDTLVGIFGINQKPTGVKDPFKCRRCALGIVRILTEKGFSLDLEALIRHAIQGYGDRLENTHAFDEVRHFILDRLKGWYLDQGITSGIVAAVLARESSHLADIRQRIDAVNDFLALSEAQALAAANKRVSKLLLREQGDIILYAVDNTLFQHDVESRLANAVSAKQQALQPLFERSDYREILRQLADLQGDVDDFFDQVMVMVDEESIRNNRLALLSDLRQLFLRVADISLL